MEEDLPEMSGLYHPYVPVSGSADIQSIHNMSKTNLILSINLTPEETIDEIEGYREIIKENIEYDSLLLAHPYDQEMVGEFLT